VRSSPHVERAKEFAIKRSINESESPVTQQDLLDACTRISRKRLFPPSDIRRLVEAHGFDPGNVVRLARIEDGTGTEFGTI